MLPTRKNLKAIGLTEDQIDSVIEMHTETVDGLKEKLRIAEEGKSNAENLQNQLVDLQKKLQQAEKYKEQYDTEKAAHDKLKSEIAGKEQKAKEDAALTRYLKANGYKIKAKSRTRAASFSTASMKNGMSSKSRLSKRVQA